VPELIYKDMSTEIFSCDLFKKSLEPKPCYQSESNLGLFAMFATGVAFGFIGGKL
jgi:hypothetical protein